MKTIDEAANNSFDRMSIAGAYIDEIDFKGAFRIGFEFAQKWNEVLPNNMPIRRKVVLLRNIDSVVETGFLNDGGTFTTMHQTAGFVVKFLRYIDLE